MNYKKFFAFFFLCTFLSSYSHKPLPANITRSVEKKLQQAKGTGHVVALRDLYHKDTPIVDIFDDIVEHHTVIIEFYSSWCGPCFPLNRTFQALAKQYSNTPLVFIKVNIDTFSRFSYDLGIRNLPTVMFFKHGQKRDQTVGPVSKNDLEIRVKNLL